MSRYFFILYPSSPELQVHIDLMCLVCDPSRIRTAHLTVRGPYTAKPKPGKWSNAKNIHVSVCGVGIFFLPKQNTVFLRCTSSELRNLWWKRDYKEPEPHITIYDGDSREFAQRALKILEKYDLSFEFVADCLQEYRSRNGQQSLEFWPSDYDTLCQEIGEPRLSLQLLRTIKDDERLVYLDKLAARLSSMKMCV